jgi:hypothetical protein
MNTSALTLTPDTDTIDLNQFEDLSIFFDPTARYSFFDRAGEISIDIPSLLDDLLALAGGEKLDHDPTMITLMVSSWLTERTRQRIPVFLEAGGRNSVLFTKDSRRENIATVVAESDAGPTYAANCQRLVWDPSNRGVTAFVTVNEGTILGMIRHDPADNSVCVATFKVISTEMAVPRALGQKIQKTHERMCNNKTGRGRDGLKQSAQRPIMVNLELVSLMQGVDGGTPQRYFPPLVDENKDPILDEEGNQLTTKSQLSMYPRLEHALQSMVVNVHNRPTYVEMFIEDSDVRLDNLPSHYTPSGVTEEMTHTVSDVQEFMPTLNGVANMIRLYREATADRDRAKYEFNKNLHTLVTWSYVEKLDAEPVLALEIEFATPVQGKWNREHDTADARLANTSVRVYIEFTQEYLPSDLAVHTTLMHSAETLGTLKARLAEKLYLGVDDVKSVTIPMVCRAG